jgi:hypothetical protein
MPTSADELANINTTDAVGQFIARAAVTNNLATGDPLAVDAATYFDDILAFQSIAETVKRANLSARDWPENFVIGYTMDNPTVAAAAGHSVSANANTGEDRLDFGSGVNRARVSGFDSGNNNEDITFNTVGGAPGIGIAGNGSNLMTSFNSERLRIDFGQSASKFAVALGDFGTYVLLGTTYTEQVEFRFSGGASNVNIVKAGCRADGGVATFSIDPGTDFNRVEIRPQGATPLSFLAITATTLADFKTCTAGTLDCFSNLATAGNRCP